MLKDLSLLFEQFSNFIKELPTSKKIVFFGSITLLLLAILSLIIFAKTPSYQVLYSGLSKEDAGKIIEKLKDKKVPYKVQSSGTILVPSSKVYELRFELASLGLPGGHGVGFEIFDKTTFGVTEFVQRINYIRALQTELARTISSLDDVETARVHIVIPKKSLYLEREELPSASVVIKLKPGRYLSKSIVSSIVYLVCCGVEGLLPKNVTVVDTEGNLLSPPTGKIAGPLFLSKFQYIKDYEANLEKKIEDIVGAVVGIGKVKAKVSVQMDFTKVSEREERYDPNVVVEREERVEESSQGMGGAYGVPGALSNLPGVSQGKAGGGATSKYTRTKEATYYKAGRIFKTTVKGAGIVKRVCAAVVVDGSYKSENGKMVYVPRSKEEMKKIEDMVKKAIGYSSERGDEVEVENIPFKKEELPKPTFLEMLGKPIIISAIKYFVVLIISVILIFSVLKPLIKSVVEMTSKREVVIKPPEEVKPEEEKIEEEAKVGAEAFKDRIMSLVEKDPAKTAQIIRQWLSEEG